MLSKFIDLIACDYKKTLTNIFKYNYPYKTPNFLLNHPELVKAARIVGKYHLDHWLDIHSKNIMQREDGTIVITDPYS